MIELFTDAPPTQCFRLHDLESMECWLLAGLWVDPQPVPLLSKPEEAVDFSGGTSLQKQDRFL